MGRKDAGCNQRLRLGTPTRPPMPLSVCKLAHAHHQPAAPARNLPRILPGAVRCCALVARAVRPREFSARAIPVIDRARRPRRQ
jgi:hypothetical protein